MRFKGLTTGLLIAAGVILFFMTCQGENMETYNPQIIKLPEPGFESGTSLEQALLHRRSVRSYTKAPLTLPEVSQLLWATQGITSQQGFRTAPSAGALYPLEIFVAAGEVQGLSPGVYRYLASSHSLKPVDQGDKRNDLWEAGLHQLPLKEAPVVFVLTAVLERTERRYGRRSMQYVLIETGHAAQNLCLQAVSLNLATVPIGAFEDSKVSRVLQLDKGTYPFYLLPTGRPAE